MKKLIIVALAAIFSIVGIAPASADLPACQTEDSTANNCYWDAQERDNGLGNSFRVVDHVVIYDAPELAGQAWALFDAVGAVELVAETEGVRIEYSGHNTTGFKLESDQIAVWDTEGNHYLFTVTK